MSGGISDLSLTNPNTVIINTIRVYYLQVVKLHGRASRCSDHAVILLCYRRGVVPIIDLYIGSHTLYCISLSRIIVRNGRHIAILTYTCIRILINTRRYVVDVQLHNEIHPYFLIKYSDILADFLPWSRCMHDGFSLTTGWLRHNSSPAAVIKDQ